MSSYVVVDQATGLVVNAIVWDGETEYDPGEGLDVVASDTASIGWTMKDGQFVPPAVPPLTAEEILALNTGTRNALLTTAALAIAPLQDAEDLAVATDEETASLKLWKQYRVAVNRIDLTAASPAWPTQPS